MPEPTHAPTPKLAVPTGTSNSVALVPRRCCGLRRGLRKDLDAVTAGLTLPYSDGPSEGANTKVKLLKRQMYGRAGFSLLRQRILLS
jgi:transposase